MPTIDEITMNQGSLNGSLSLSLVLVLDIMQKMSLPAGSEASVSLLKELLQQTPRQGPPGCRGEAVQVSASRAAISADLDAEFEAFWDGIQPTKS